MMITAMRPDRAHVVLGPRNWRGGGDTLYVWVDPAYPDAWRQGAMRDYLRGLSARGLKLIVVIGDEQVLIEEGTAVGLDATEIVDVLHDQRYLDRIETQTRAAIQLGANGVPAWVIDARLLVPGAQPHEVFTSALEQVGLLAVQPPDPGIPPEPAALPADKTPGCGSDWFGGGCRIGARIQSGDDLPVAQRLRRRPALSQATRQ